MKRNRDVPLLKSPKKRFPPAFAGGSLKMLCQSGCDPDGVAAAASASFVTTTKRSESSYVPASVRYGPLVKVIVPGPPWKVEVPTAESACTTPSRVRVYLPTAGFAAPVVGLTYHTLYTPWSSRATFVAVTITESGTPMAPVSVASTSALSGNSASWSGIGGSPSATKGVAGA